MNKLLLLAAATLAVSSVQAQSIVPLTNGDFDDGVANFPDGFDADPDIPGWSDLTVITDSGVEGPGAWWNPYEGHAAFLKKAEGAFNLSTYTIQAGDTFDVSFFGKTWDASSHVTVTLFYDDPANVIGSFSTGLTPTWTQYSTSTAIDAIAGSVGGLLGISILNTATDSGNRFANFDEVQVSVTSAIPEPSSFAALAGLVGLAFAASRRRHA